MNWLLNLLKTLLTNRSAPVPVTPTPAPTPPTPTSPVPPTPVAPTPAVVIPSVTVVTDPQNPQLSAHFYYKDLVITEHRDFLVMNATEGMQYLENMRRLCNEILEPMIVLLGEVQHVSSCFRCPRLNAVIGGKTNSQHMVAEAADQEFRMPLKDAYNRIMASQIPYSQLIFEFGSWVHVGVTDSILYPGKKRENWIASIVDGKVTYTPVTRAI